MKVDVSVTITPDLVRDSSSKYWARDLPHQPDWIKRWRRVQFVDGDYAGRILYAAVYFCKGVPVLVTDYSIVEEAVEKLVGKERYYLHTDQRQFLSIMAARNKPVLRSSEIPFGKIKIPCEWLEEKERKERQIQINKKVAESLAVFNADVEEELRRLDRRNAVKKMSPLRRFVHYLKNPTEWYL